MTDPLTPDGSLVGEALEPDHPAVLSTPARRRQSPEGRPRGRDAEAADDSQCVSSCWDSVAAGGGTERVTVKTVLGPSLAAALPGTKRAQGEEAVRTIEALACQNIFSASC